MHPGNLLVLVGASMVSDTIRQHAVSGLREAREELLAIPKETLTYPAIAKWLEKWVRRMSQAESAGGGLIYANVCMYLQGHDASPYDVLYEVCLRIVALLDTNIVGIDSSQTVVPVLDGLILKVADTKLSTLLKEFNAGKESQPNSAAITFRTILMLVIQERAKRTKPQASIATDQDLDLNKCLNAAATEKLFDSAEQKLLHQFKSGGQKGIFDNIAHKPGNNSLIEKEHLSDAVDLLNKLLPTVV